MRKIFAWIAPIVWFGDEIVRRIVFWAAFFVLVSGAMSWVASYITQIAQYGWGAIVFAGIGVACVITLVASAALVAWRYFKPIPEPPVKSSENGQVASVLDDVLSRLAETERGTARNKERLEELQTEVTILTQKGAMLTRSLRARDAECIIKEADKAIMSTSKKLLEEPDSYANESAWAADYATWKNRINLVNSVLQQWNNNHKSFFEIRPEEFERSMLPPHSNVKSEPNATRFKTVGIAQQRYTDMRDGVLESFDLKVRELPD